MNTTNVEISIIMLTYNRETLLSHMIECILAQTFKNFEFIIVDNGSSDSSGNIADKYALKDKRIRVIHKERGNIGSGRNAGLDVAIGKYIMFVDDDDSCTEDFVDFLYNIIVDNNADISICGATWSNNDRKILMNAEEAMDSLLNRKDFNVAFPTKCFKKELFENNRFAEIGKYDDIYLMPKIIANANKIIYYGLSKYHFNRHDNNNSAWTQNHSLIDLETLSEYLNVYDERTKWLCNVFPSNKDKWNYFNWSFMISMVEKIIRYNINDCNEQFNQMKDTLLKNKTSFLNSPYIKEFEKNWYNKYINNLK